MKNHILSAAFVVVLVALLASGQASHRKDSEAAIRRVRQEFVAAINAKRLDRALELMAPDVVVLVEGRTAFEGRVALGPLLERLFASGATWQLTMETTRLEWDGNLAYELGRYTRTLQRPDGTWQRERGKYVDVWKRQPGREWRIVVHAPSEDPAEEPSGRIEKKGGSRR